MLKEYDDALIILNLHRKDIHKALLGQTKLPYRIVNRYKKALKKFTIIAAKLSSAASSEKKLIMAEDFDRIIFGDVTARQFAGEDCDMALYNGYYMNESIILIEKLNELGYELKFILGNTGDDIPLHRKKLFIRHAAGIAMDFTYRGDVLALERDAKSICEEHNLSLKTIIFPEYLHIQRFYRGQSRVFLKITEPGFLNCACKISRLASDGELGKE